MALNQWWMILVAVGIALVAVGVGVALGLRGSHHPHSGGARLARAEQVRALPSFAKAVRTRQLTLAGVVLAGVIAVALGGVVAARPMASETIRPVNTSRDIMLCLDVSGSMTDVDAEVIDVFVELLKGFKGERIGLTIFNSSPVQVFPLTDDYTFAKERLQSLKQSFDYTDDLPEHWAGTLNGEGASLIGDGLGACAMGFDNPDKERSRSIIFASDNEVNGASIMTVAEAAAYAKQAGVRVFALNPVAGKSEADTKELSDAANETGGRMYELRGTTTVTEVITEVQQQDARALQGQIQVIWADSPNLWIVLFVVAALGAVLLVWRVRL